MSASATIPLSPLRFAATNVTGTQEEEFAVDPQLSARSAAESIQARMGLPDDVSWALRDDHSSVYLDDSRPMGDQIAPGAKVTITPRTHLGGGRIVG